ncbi:MAG: ATP-binding protein [Lachnospiraceae bacterium]|nr:ATP-binding protein [Lachnospiraceae bacterium]
MEKNPYNLTFGKEPIQVISRAGQMIEITEAFRGEPASQQIFMITGVRGSGKTVFMTEAAKELSQSDEWVVVELNSSGDLLQDLAASLASENTLARIFQNASINLSLFGIGLEVKESVPISNIQVALSKMLASLKKHGKKALICIDEAIPSDNMKTFAGAFQILIRQDLPVYLLMTGLYENINNLQNEKNLTFLYRAPKIELKPLNIRNIAENYRNNFRIDTEDATEMAALTKGYPFAFQVLGYFTWKNKGDHRKALPEFRQYLEDYVYEKIWSEMSEIDRRLAYGAAKAENGRAKEIKALMEISDDEYSVYRDRLIKRGILDGSKRGYIRFTLPLFDEYVVFTYDIDKAN